MSSLQPWVSQAAAAGMYVVLDLQPGRASLLAQAQVYQSLLRLPNVGLAIDAEWKLQPGQQPLRQIGHVDIGEVNSVVHWLAALTARYQLPQKLLVLHQFQLSMINGERDLDTSEDDLAIVVHMDGQGTQPGEAGNLERGDGRGTRQRVLRVEELPGQGPPNAHPAADDDEYSATGDDLVPVASADSRRVPWTSGDGRVRSG